MGFLNLSAWFREPTCMASPAWTQAPEHLEASQRMGHGMKSGLSFSLELGIWSFPHPTKEFVLRP